MNSWIDNETRMFLGSADDSVARFPWEGVSVSLEDFNRTLVFHALLGPRLCVRSGNILYNPTYFEAIRDPSSSPLLEFAKAGFLQVQTKEPGFNASIEKRQSINTNSTKVFIEKYGWLKSEKNDVYSQLANIDAQLEEGKGRLHYNPDFVSVFKHLCNHLVVPDESPFQVVFDQWYRQFDEIDRSRSNFEELTKQIFANDDYIKRYQAMRVINSINHYAYGIALSSAPGGASIETKEIPDFQSLTHTVIGQEEREVSLDLLDELRGRRVLEILQETLLVPARLFEGDTNLWAQFAKLLDRDNGAQSQEFLQKKQTVISLAFRMLSVSKPEQLEKELRAAAKEYSKFLNSALGTKSRRQLGMRMNFVWRKASEKATSFALDATIGPYVNALKEEALDLAQVGVDLVVSLGNDAATGAVMRGMDHVRLKREDAAKIFGDDLRKVFNGLAIRGMDISTEEFLQNRAD